MKLSYSTRFLIRDFLQGLKLGTLDLQIRLKKHLKEQKKSWPKEKQYTQGYFYQGFEDIGITGCKPTHFRFRQYEVDNFLLNAEILDIGSNCGFVSCYCARLGKAVTGIELNPYLNKVAKETQQYLNLSNIEFLESDFLSFETDKKFDVILSFSNHHTIDGNLHISFEKYLQKILKFLKPNGYLLFESHNVFAKGIGELGDDGDMNKKMEIMNQYFDIEKYKMIKCFLKHGKEDLDKLFIVAQQSEKPKKVDFDLTDAINKYHY